MNAPSFHFTSSRKRDKSKLSDYLLVEVNGEIERARLVSYSKFTGYYHRFVVVILSIILFTNSERVHLTLYV